MLTLLILALSLTAAPLTATPSPERLSRPIHYDVTVSVRPDTGSLGAEARVTVKPFQAGLRRLTFYLHETFVIDRLRVDDTPARWVTVPAEPSRTRPAARLVVVTLPRPTGEDPVVITLHYHGALKVLPEWGTGQDGEPCLDDRISPQRVELADYSTWFPSWPYGITFDAEVELRLPSGWIAVPGGEVVMEADDGTWHQIRWRTGQTNDLVVLAAPDFKKRDVSNGTATVAVYYTRLPEAFVDREAGRAQAVLSLFSRWLGPVAGDDMVMRHVFVPREMGQGGYARPGLVVTSEGRVRQALEKDGSITFLRGNAHEIAHFWWRFGTGQGDWINEALAEGFAVLAVRHLQSPVTAAKILERYRRAVAGLPAGASSLAEVPAINDDTGYILRYYKGALLVDALRQHLGEEAFLAACREFYTTFHEKTASTADFRTFWRAKLGADAVLIDKWLDAPGRDIPK